MARILVASGNFHDCISNVLKSINHKKLFIEEIIPYINETRIEFDLIIITDDAILKNEHNTKMAFDHLCDVMIKNDNLKQIYFMTCNPIYKRNTINENIKIIYFDYIRIPYSKYLNVAKTLSDKKALYKDDADNQKNQNIKTSFWGKFKSKSKDETEIKATSERERKLSNISRGIHKVVAITGHRGVGVTSTAVNLGAISAKRGLSTIIVDLDVDFRSVNLYFSGLNEASENDEDLKSSLVRTLANPQDYEATTFSIRDNLRMTSLPYSFTDKRLLNQFYITTKLIGMLSIFRHRFNLCILDLPFEYMKTFKELLVHIDTIGYCVSNNTYSILNTLRNAENILDSTSLNYLNAKSKVIVTKYNDRSICNNEILNSQRVCELLTFEISDCFKSAFELAGHISYDAEFDLQLGTEIPIALTNSSFERMYENVLLRLLE